MEDARTLSAGEEAGLSSMTSEEDMEGGREGAAEGGSEVWPYRRQGITNTTWDLAYMSGLTLYSRPSAYVPGIFVIVILQEEGPTQPGTYHTALPSHSKRDCLCWSLHSTSLEYYIHKNF